MTYRMEADGSARLSERHLAKPGSFPKSLAAKPPFWNRPVLRVRRPVVGGSGNGGCWIEPAILGHERERRVCPNPKRCAPGESDQNTPFPIRAGYVGSRRKLSVGRRDNGGAQRAYSPPFMAREALLEDVWGVTCPETSRRSEATETICFLGSASSDR